MYSREKTWCVQCRIHKEVLGSRRQRRRYDGMVGARPDQCILDAKQRKCDFVLQSLDACLNSRMFTVEPWTAQIHGLTDSDSKNCSTRAALRIPATQCSTRGSCRCEDKPRTQKVTRHHLSPSCRRERGARTRTIHTCHTKDGLPLGRVYP